MTFYEFLQAIPYTLTYAATIYKYIDVFYLISVYVKLNNREVLIFLHDTVIYHQNKSVTQCQATNKYFSINEILSAFSNTTKIFSQKCINISICASRSAHYNYQNYRYAYVRISAVKNLLRCTRCEHI